MINISIVTLIIIMIAILYIGYTIGIVQGTLVANKVIKQKIKKIKSEYEKALGIEDIQQ